MPFPHCSLSSLPIPHLFPLAMASGGHKVSHSQQPSPKSCAQIASQATRTIASFPLHNTEILHKIKETSLEFIKIDGEALNRAHMKFQNSLYGKFFGKPPPFEQVKQILMVKWADIAEILISDLPNGFLLIQCGSHMIMQKLF